MHQTATTFVIIFLGAVCLHSAAKNNHVDVVATLLKKGAHVDARTKVFVFI